MKPQVKAWITAAEDDLLVVEEIIENAALTHMVAFHCEQAVEKLFKACLESNGERVPKTHNLDVLKERVSNYYDIEFDDVIFDQLNELYIESRYPSDIGLLPTGKPTLLHAKGFYQFTRNMIIMIRDLL